MIQILQEIQILLKLQILRSTNTAQSTSDNTNFATNTTTDTNTSQTTNTSASTNTAQSTNTQLHLQQLQLMLKHQMQLVYYYFWNNTAYVDNTSQSTSYETIYNIKSKFKKYSYK